MADINSNVRLDIDGSGALATLRELQRQISAFQTAMSKGNAANRTAAANLQKDLINNINATGQFAASVKNVRTTTEQFTTSLEKNKLSLGEYFRYGMGSTKSFGRLFKTEMATVEKVARERVKTIQTQYIKLGRDANGAMKSIAVRPLTLDMENLATRTAIAAQKQQIFNQVLKQGSTNLLNFGKNTQWAGRQLMVGFTIPLTMFATTAGKAFMDMEKQIIRLRRVYGDFNTSVQQTDAMVESVKNLANEFTKYGVAVEKTMGLAADAAAMGKQGADLTAQVTEATRLAVLGGVEQEQALETTISLTNAFGTAADKLAGKINFLNSVENQTVTSIEDLTIAIPKAGPVVQQLGGDVEDLAFFLTAMREGGINASEGANALKSGLASLINPTAKASEFLQGFGINIKGIVEANKGNINGLVVDFASALDKLDPLNRARAIEQLFGKFQFSRLSTLFQNVIKDGSQASQVLKLTRNSTEELAIVAERELKKLEDSPLTKFQKSIEEVKAALIPLGEQFLKIATPIIEFATEALKEFNKLSDGTKSFIVAMTAGLGIIGPVAIMTFGLLANGVANIIKGFAAVRNVFLKLRGGTGALGESVNYLTQEQLEALSVSASLNQVHQKLRQTYTSEASAINSLTAAYSRATAAQAGFAVPATKRARPPKKYNSGVISVPGSGNRDTVPAMLTPGEAVIPKKYAERYAPLINAMVEGKIPGFNTGKTAELQKSHLQGSLDEKDPAVRKQLLAMFPNWDKMPKELKERFLVSGSLTADLSRKLNQGLRDSKGGMNPDKFLESWNAIDGKLEATAQAGGLDISDKANVKAVRELEVKIGKKVAQEAIRRGVKVTDSLVAEITRSTLGGVIKSGGPLGAAASAIESRRTVIGDFRSNLKKAEAEDLLRRGVLSQVGQQVVDPVTGAVFGDIRRSKSTGKNLGFKQKTQVPRGGKGYFSQPLLARVLDPVAAMISQSGSSAGAVTTRAGRRGKASAQDAVAASLNKSSKSRSPSKKMVEATDNIVDGVEKGLEDGQKKVRTAAARLGETAAASFEDGGTKRVKLTQSGKYMNRETGKFLSKDEAKRLMSLDSKNERARARAAEAKKTPTVKVTRRKPRTTSGASAEDDTKKRGYRPSKFGVVGSSLGMAASMAGGSMGNEALMNAGNVAFLVSALADVANLFKGGKIVSNVKGFGNVVKTAFSGAKAARSSGTAAAVAAGRSAAANAGGKAAVGLAGRLGAGFAARMGASALGGPIAPIIAGLGILATGFEIANEVVKETAKGLRVFGEDMQTTSSELQGFAEATGQATPSEIMKRRRGSQFSTLGFAAGKTPFGNTFLETDAGLAMLEGAAEIAKTDRQAAIKSVGRDLATAIATGMLTKEQAYSVATALGDQLGDFSLSVGITGKIQELVGLDGYDVTKHPIDVAVNLLIEDDADLIGEAIQRTTTQNGLNPLEWFNGLFNGDTAQYTADIEDMGSYASSLTENGQLLLDTIDSAYLPIIESLEKQGKIAEASAKKQEYEEKRSKALQAYTTKFSTLMQSVAGMEGYKGYWTEGSAENAQPATYQISRTGTDVGAVDTMVEGLQQSINVSFEGDENEPIRKLAEKIADEGEMSGTAKIAFLVNLKAGNIDPATAASWFEEGGIFYDDGTNGGAGRQQLYVDIVTDLGGAAGTQLANVLQMFSDANVHTGTLIAQFKTAGKPEDKQAILDIYSMVGTYKDTFGDLTMTATLKYLQEGDNIKDLLGNLKTLNDLKANGELNVESIIKSKVITDPAAIEQLKNNQEWFSKLDPVQQVLYMQTIMTVKFDESEVDAYIKQNSQGGTYVDPYTKKQIIGGGKYNGSTFETDPNSNPAIRAAAKASMARREAEEVINVNSINNLINGGDPQDPTGGTKPDSSWLDDYVRRAKNALKWTQKLTTGFDASAAALRGMNVASGGVGLEEYLKDKLKAVGLSPEMVKIITELSDEEQKQFVKKYFNKGQMSQGLNAQGEKLVAFERKLVLEETADAYKTEADAAQMAAKARDLLISRGFDEADATQLAADSQVAWALTSAKTTAALDIQLALIKKRITAIQESKTVEERFGEAFDKAMGIIGDRKEAVEIQFEADTKALEDGIRKAQDQIDIIVNEPGGIDDLQYGLDQIGWQEDEINKKYDKRLDALDKVEEARKRAIQAQQAEFDLARAMASGDSGAAASAIQKFRADKASQAADARRRMLEQARDTEIRNISVSVNGVKLTRDQIEQSILDKTKQIAKIEEDSIEPARYKIQIMEDARDDIIATLVDQEIKWKLLDAQVKNAAYNAWNYTKALEAANALLGNTTAAPAKTPFDFSTISATSKDVLTSRVGQANETYFKGVVEAVETGVASSSQITDYVNAAGGNTGRRVALARGGMVKYFANGGQPLGSDIVPAMLTPGEFVMSKYAVSSFGADNMKAINNGSYKNDSVYNYEVNINVRSDANADQIARTVMMQLQQVDAQRVRGGRI